VLNWQKKKDEVFSRFRDRYATKAAAENKAVAFPLFYSLLDVDHDGTVSLNEFLIGAFFITKATVTEKFRYSLALAAKHKDTLSKDKCLSATRLHYQLQFDIIRTVLPNMVYKHTRETPTKKSSGTPTAELCDLHDHTQEECFLQSLKLLGITNDVIEETRCGVEETLQALLTVSDMVETDGSIRVDKWWLAWTSNPHHAHLLDLVSVTGMGALIQFAIAVSERNGL